VNSVVTEDEKQKLLRERFLQYTKRVEKTDPDLAKRIRKNIDRLVSWYMDNRRDITTEEFDKIIES